jgi:hypothetical protein
MVRIDFIFSYWIFLWYLLYIFKLVEYNPKIAIICGFIENIIILSLMIYNNTKKKLIILFFIMFILLKIIPLYSISNTIIHFKDIKISIILFFIYLIWMNYNKKTFFDFIKQTNDLIFYNKNTLPGMLFIDKIIYHNN